MKLNLRNMTMNLNTVNTLCIRPKLGFAYISNFSDR